MNEHLSLPGNAESPARLLVRIPLCDKSVSQEYTNDFTLPDYLPEIRKMLRVTATVLPAESYATPTAAEYAGELRYRVLYVGADGALHSAELPAEYTLSVQIDPPDTCDTSMGIDAWLDAEPELVVTRVLSPRKLGIRCRLKAHARANGWNSLEETLSGAPNGAIERLTGEADAAVVLRGVSSPIEVSDEILDGAPLTADPLRVISGEGRVLVSEAVAEKNRVNLRGELLLKLLCTRESPDGAEGASASPTVTQRRLPFSAAVEVDGADRLCDARGFGTLSNLSVTVEDGRILADAELLLTAECQKNERFAFTRDLFSTGSDCRTAFGEITLPFALAMQNGNFTLSDAIPLEGSGIGASDRILDATGEVSVEAVTENGGKTVFTGTAQFHALTENEESREYGYADFSLPFRYVADTRNDSAGLPAVSDYDARFEPLTVRLKSDGERLAVDAEISVSIRTAGSVNARLLKEAKFGDAVKKTRGAIVLAYPTPDATLWEAAKKYHVSVPTLAEQNALEADPDAPLSGVRYLLVQE